MFEKKTSTCIVGRSVSGEELVEADELGEGVEMLAGLSQSGHQLVRVLERQVLGRRLTRRRADLVVVAGLRSSSSAQEERLGAEPAVVVVLAVDYLLVAALVCSGEPPFRTV